jgi:Flp pilus assembly protein CpaB
VLQSTDLKTVLWPNEKLPAGAYENVDPLIGNTVYDTIGDGEPVLANRLANSQSGGGSGVPSGMRAISIHVTDSTGVLALLRPGQKVDVQVVAGRNPNDLAARTVLEDLKVLSVTLQPEQSSQAQNLPVVTLLAKPPEADILALADSGARVRLTLRNPLDDDMRIRMPLSLETVMRPGKP